MYIFSNTITKKSRSSLVVLVSLICLYPEINVVAQVGTSIPDSRRADWHNTGYERKPDDNLPENTCTEITVDPDSSASENYNNIMAAIRQASTHPCNGEDKYITIKLSEGIYALNRPIILKPEHHHIILKGAGKVEDDQISHTVIERIAGYRSSTTIRTSGRESKKIFEIEEYDPSRNAIKISSPIISSGDYLDIQTPNDTLWANSQHSIEPDVLGQIVRVRSQLKPGWFVLADDFSLVWNLAKRRKKKPYFREIEPVHHIGIENLTIRNNNKVDSAGFLIHIIRSSNIWINNISSDNADNTHVNITQSTQVEVRNSYFHHATFYGGGGYGYGVSLSKRTNNTVIENNWFQSLRHCIIFSRGASRNVAGYNFCTKQMDTIGNRLGSISIHGNYPFLNLIEGNVIERIMADNYHGKNGPYNTYFRNYVYDEKILLEPGNDSANVMSNEGKLTIEKPGNRNIIFWSDGEWLTDNPLRYKRKENRTVNDISYYKTERPGFLSEKNYSWPPIGPPINHKSKSDSTIPAVDIFCSRYRQICESKDITYKLLER